MISVVIPAYNEAESVEELYREIRRAVSAIPDAGDLQVIFVDDGSTDDTAARIEEIARRDSAVMRISFDKNRGKAAALTAGFRAAEGEFVFTMDADLQDDPRGDAQVCSKTAGGIRPGIRVESESTGSPGEASTVSFVQQGGVPELQGPSARF